MTNAMCSHCKCEIQEGQEKFLHHKVLCPTCDKNMKARHDGSFKIYRQAGLYGKAGKLPNASREWLLNQFMDKGGNFVRQVPNTRADMQVLLFDLTSQDSAAEAKILRDILADKEAFFSKFTEKAPASRGTKKKRKNWNGRSLIMSAERSQPTEHGKKCGICSLCGKFTAFTESRTTSCSRCETAINRISDCLQSEWAEEAHRAKFTRRLIQVVERNTGFEILMNPGEDSAPTPEQPSKFPCSVKAIPMLPPIPTREEMNHYERSSVIKGVVQDPDLNKALKAEMGTIENKWMKIAASLTDRNDSNSAQIRKLFAEIDKVKKMIDSIMLAVHTHEGMN